jgi:hydroxymethylpyrimidine/phosphomethylpyrimidine kinase
MQQVSSLTDASPCIVAEHQLKAVWDDGPPQAIKLGMLTSASTVDALAAYFARVPNASGSKPVIVLDPVMISTSGHMLVGDEAMASIRKNLIQHVDWLTPNIPEAMALTDMADEGDMNIESLFDMMDVSHELSVKYNAPYLLLKGGHRPWSRREIKTLASAAVKAGVELVWLDDGEEGDCVEVLQRQAGAEVDENSYMIQKMVVDLLQERDSDRTTWFISKYIRSSSTHGTGCTLSSALACSIALAAESGRPARYYGKFCADLQVLIFRRKRSASELSNTSSRPSHRRTALGRGMVP